MGVRKLSVSLPSKIADAAALAAAKEGVGLSAWLAHAAQDRLDANRAIDVGYQAAQELIIEYVAEHGPIPEEVRQWTNDALVAAGLRPEPLDSEHRAVG